MIPFNCRNTPNLCRHHIIIVLIIVKYTSLLYLTYWNKKIRKLKNLSQQKHHRGEL